MKIKRPLLVKGKKKLIAIVQPEHEDYYSMAHDVQNIDDPDKWLTEERYYGLGAAPVTQPEQAPWYGTLATGAMNLYQQYQFARANDKRIQAGQVPIDAREYAAAQLPAARAEVGLDKSTRDMMMYGGIAVAGLVIMSLLTKKRGR